MLQTVIRPSIERARIDVAGVLDDVAGHAADRPIWPIRPRIRSLATTPRPGWPSNAHAQRLRPALRQRLRREHVLDLARADAERERAERAVRRRVASRRRRSSCPAA